MGFIDFYLSYLKELLNMTNFKQPSFPTNKITIITVYEKKSICGKKSLKNNGV